MARKTRERTNSFRKRKENHRKQKFFLSLYISLYLTLSLVSYESLLTFFEEAISSKAIPNSPSSTQVMVKEAALFISAKLCVCVCVCIIFIPHQKNQTYHLLAYRIVNIL
jgi:hypothetical protein